MTEYQLDLSTYLCPLPVLMAKNALAELEHPARVAIQISPNSTIRDFELMCQKEGYRFIGTEPCGGLVKLIIEK